MCDCAWPGWCVIAEIRTIYRVEIFHQNSGTVLLNEREIDN